MKTTLLQLFVVVCSFYSFLWYNKSMDTIKETKMTDQELAISEHLCNAQARGIGEDK